ncbi:hypothetical protein AB0M54_06670 [Actinoplanes sp. NPDC051470]|uniref:hypothetical protein n=1 Tax=Actinoplanes sp. NPDC051470 TaxID=3157224 RepID=UPI00342CB881
MSGGPASALGVPAEVLAPDRVRLLFAPWAALNAARADVYRVRKEEDGRLWAQEKLDVGWVNQTVYFQNNCGRTITFRVFRAGASLPCVAVEPGEQGGWRWNRAAWVTGYELDCELEE